MKTTALEFESDALRLVGGAALPPDPKGVLVLLHGIPSIAPPAPGDLGYEGFGLDLARRGWVAVWGGMRAAKGSPGFFSIEHWVRDALVIFDSARRLDGTAGLPAVFVGSSAGGAVAAEAVRRGAPAAALITLGTPAEWGDFAANPAAGAELIAQQSGMALAPGVLDDPHEWGAEFDIVTTERSIVDLDIPILIVHGTDDVVVPVEHAHRLVDLAPGAELRILDGAPHQLRLWHETAALIDEWLESVL